MRVSLDALQSLAWPARRLAVGGRSGTQRSTLRGRAPELSAYRAYRAGDDVRDMDWKLLARSDRSWIRLSEDRAIHPTWFVLDATASMAFPVGTLAKWRAVCALAEGLAFLAHKVGDPVGGSVVGGDPGEGALMPVSTRRDIVPTWRALLDGVVPGGSAPLAPAVASAPVRGRLVILSDLLGDAAACRDAANRWLVSGSEVIVLHVLSQAEWMPAGGSVVDPEDATRERVLGPEGIPAYAAALAQWVRDEEDWWVGRGAAFHRIVAEEDVIGAIRRVVGGPRAVGAR